MRSWLPCAAALVLALATAPVALAREDLLSGQPTPTGKRVTPEAMPGAVFQSLNPDLPGLPDFTAGQAAEMALSPDGGTLLIPTAGYNRNVGPDGKFIPDLSNEYVFVYDVAGPLPVKRQVIPVPNTYLGLAWHPAGDRFYLSGGVDDAVREFRRGEHGFEPGRTLALGHKAGLGLQAKPEAAGIAPDPDGNRLLVANLQNESVSLLDLASGAVLAEQDLRPGVIDPARRGEPGGTFPNAVAWASATKAYVTSQRDRELVALNVEGGTLQVAGRLKVSGQPTALLTSPDRRRLYVALDNSDSVPVVDTATDGLIEEIPATAPRTVLLNPRDLKGASPNNLALSPDGGTLFVTDGGLNAVAVVRLDDQARGVQPAAKRDDDGDDDDDTAPASAVVGLIPTGWYPTAVAVRPDGRRLFVVNGKSAPGPNPLGCRDILSIAPDALDRCKAANNYVWQLEKAGFLSMPVPTPAQLARLTRQVAANDFPGAVARAADGEVMELLRARIRHVVFVVKENRSYDQVLGDLEVGDGDPSLTLLPAPITPNHHALARRFVTLDNFLDSGETSNTGWNWTTAARTTDFTEREAPVNYAGRGLQYDQEGTNRNVNVALPTAAARTAANPATPDDPDLLAGTADVAAPDGPGGEAGAGYLWDAAIRARLEVRNYGFYGDLARYDPHHPAPIPLEHDPAARNLRVFFPTKAALADRSDPYFRGFDQAFPDYWRLKEWEREFDAYVAAGRLPALSLVRLPHDHFGAFADATDGVDTVETEMADNDYALGRLIEKLAHSPFAEDTLVFVVEDDAQDGADHVDAHRSLAFVAGPYVRQGAVVSERYTTVNLLRTIEDVLGLEPMGLNDGLAAPMTAVFDPERPGWTYDVVVPDVLRTTRLPLPAPTRAELDPCHAAPAHDAAYWQAAMAGQDFSAEDRLDTPRFNAALWRGLKGEAAPPPPTEPSGRDLRAGRDRLLAAAAPRCGGH
jgi:YVTN family beta-propeller protein